MADAATLDKPPSYSGFGRPSELSYDLINRVAERVRGGSYPLPAARAEGIAERTWLRWTAQGKADDDANIPSIHAHLWQTLDRKEAEGECELIEQSLTRKIGWQGPMTVLSRRHRTRWEDKAESHQNGLVIQIGGGSGDIQVAVLVGAQPTFAPSIPLTERRCEESLAIEAGSDKSAYVNEPTP